VCVTARLLQPAATLRDAAELGLFLLYIALNLAWYSLRTLSIAVDLYLFYEKLELTRRIITVSTMLAMLAGLPIIAFLICVNGLWGLLLMWASAKLMERGALAPRFGGFVHELLSFVRLNSGSIVRSGTSALSAVFAATFPYYFVPLVFGLGAAPIILEVTFRIFRGTSVIYAAACDLTLPGQTRALAARDVRRLVRTTMLAVGFCSVPAILGCAALIFAGDSLFKLLLHSAATIPPQITPILVVLLLVNVVQIVAEALLQHTGYFRNLARVGALVAIMMVAAAVLTVLAKLDIVGFLAAYTAVFAMGTLGLALAAVYGPIRAAAQPGDPPLLPGIFRAPHSAPPAPSAIPARQGKAR